VKSIWRRGRHRSPVSPAPATTAPADQFDYDAQSDLALPTTEPAPDAFVPFAGQVVPTDNHPAYDIERDTGSA
jgi:hypothetical protein